MGSVKDLQILDQPSPTKMGRGRFVFSDRYSVFDWGQMPDDIPHKGAALCMMGAYFFEQAEEKGMRTHYRGLAGRNGKLIRTDEARHPLNVMEVDLARVMRPAFSGGEYDYSVFGPHLINVLVPLEFIYRNGLPAGSSVFKRLERKQTTPEQLGLDHYPAPGERFTKPILDVSTKLEETDRYITWQEAQEIAGMTTDEVFQAQELLQNANVLISAMAERAGLVNEDGKIELGFGPQRNLMLVDVAGTLDECRFTRHDVHVSKEVARIFYRETPWFSHVEEAKAEAKLKGVEDWRSLSKSRPPHLDSELLGIISQMYTSSANAFIGRHVFDSPPLGRVIDDYQGWLERQKAAA